MVLGIVLLVLASALMVAILKFIRAHAQVGIARTGTARAEALMESAQEASAIAAETARTAMGQTSEALEIAKGIGVVDEKVTSLAEYLVSKIEGDAPAQHPGRHARALPSANDLPAVNSGNGILP